jgi:hypothetical protein
MSTSKEWIASVGFLVIAALVVWEVRRVSERVPRPAAAVPSSPVVALPAAAPSKIKPLQPKVKAPPARAKIHAQTGVLAKSYPPVAPQPAPVTAKAGLPSLPLPVIPHRPPVPPAPPPLPTEWKGNEDTAIRHSGQIVVTKEGQWIHFWAEHHPDEAAPDVDFTHNMVVGVFVGERPAHLFSVQITNLRTTPKDLIVEYAERTPPPGTFEMGVSVYPYDIKAIPRTTLPVEFKKVNP